MCKQLKKSVQNVHDWKRDAVIIICSTPYSRRVYKKCFKRINKIPVLEHILNRVSFSGLDVVVALPDAVMMTHDDMHKYTCISTDNNAFISHGNKDSPLHRMASAVESYSQYTHNSTPKYIVRITHDDILIDIKTMHEMIHKALSQNANYVYSPDIIDGAGVEIIRTKTLLEAAKNISYPVEHISYFVKTGRIIRHVPRETICRDYRLTLDYPDDVIVLESVFRNVGNSATVDTICDYLDKNKILLKYNQLPILTIYTCVHNAKKYIDQTISSIMMAINNSKYKIEYIVIDDFSDDGSLDEIIKCSMLYKDSIKIIVNESNLGLASSANIALTNARGKYILRIDADDILNYFELDNALEYAIKNDYTVLYSDYNQINENGEYRGYGKGKSHHHPGGTIMNKQIINELKFKEGLRHWDGFDLHQRLKVYSKFKIGYLQKALFCYRAHNASMSRNNLRERAQVKKRLHEEHYSINK